MLAGVGEEILMRGTLQRILTGFVGPLWALGIISALFGAGHVLNAGATTLGVVAIALEAGALLGAAYLLTGRLWLPMGIHIAWNAVQGGVFGSTISGIDGTRGLARASWSGPQFLTGGTMGMEGSVVTVIVGLLAGIALLFMAHRRGRLLRAE
nr:MULTISPECIES: CPBP family intramembrane glutamic endopeptidase [Actinomyces]